MNDVTSTNASNASGGTNEATILGHPRGLIVLFLTDMWERFPFDGLPVLLMI